MEGTEIFVRGNSSGSRADHCFQIRSRPYPPARLRAEPLEVIVLLPSGNRLFIHGIMTSYPTSYPTATISLQHWRKPDSEVLVAIKQRRPLGRSDDLRALATEVLKGLAERKDEDIDEWALRIAKDVADAND